MKHRVLNRIRQQCDEDTGFFNIELHLTARKLVPLMLDEIEASRKYIDLLDKSKFRNDKRTLNRLLLVEKELKVRQSALDDCCVNWLSREKFD